MKYFLSIVGVLNLYCFCIAAVENDTISQDDQPGCYLPAFSSDTGFNLYDIDGNEIEGSPTAKVPINSTIVIKCNDEYYRYLMADGSRKSTSICQLDGASGSWFPPIKFCYKSCESVDPSLHVAFDSCTRWRETVNCSDTLIAGSSVVANCIRSYHSAELRRSDNAYCGDDGIWTNLPTCVEDCGEIRSVEEWPDPPPRIYNEENGIPVYPAIFSRKVIFGRYAWHVAIYRVDKDPPSLVCGGTIVSSRIILSAARCFFNEKKNKPYRRPIDYEIAVAKESKNYDNEDNAYTKKYNVKEIIFFDKEYNPKISGNYGSDIAIVVPEEAIEFHKDYVFPSCLAWSDLPYYNPGEGVLGEVYSWNSNDTENLSYVEVPYIGYNECIRKVEAKYMAPDKFCAGGSFGEADSGGGFQVTWLNRYYIRGILSGNGNSFISTFTDISYYIRWIRDVKDKLSKGLPGGRESNFEENEDEDDDDDDTNSVVAYSVNDSTDTTDNLNAGVEVRIPSLMTENIRTNTEIKADKVVHMYTRQGAFVPSWYTPHWHYLQAHPFYHRLWYKK